MSFSDLPATAAWRHVDARDGFESVFAHDGPSGHRIEGQTAAVEDGQVWAVRYEIFVDERWRTRSARVWGWSAIGVRERHLDADGAGRWEIDGSPAPELDGCLDVDLESSACTNTFPVHRLALRVGESAEAASAYVRALDLRVERLEQSYARVDNQDEHQRYDYRAPMFSFEARLVYDVSGLVLRYPGIATRVH